MYSLTIVGGGAIACGYDFLNDEKILTHIHAVLKHDKIKLDAVVETNKVQQKTIVEKWGEDFSIFSTLEESLAKFKSDIVIVATPTSTHLNIVEEIIKKYTPKLIICEKPLVSNLQEFKYLNEILRKSSTKLITNFSRRFDPSFNKLKEIIKNDEKFHFYGTFTKGLVHNGSHLIDLINNVVDTVIDIKSIEYSVEDNNIYGQFVVKTKSCSGIISNIKDPKLSVFELVIYTNNAKIEVINTEQKIKLVYVDKTNIIQDFELYIEEEILDFTMKKHTYNTLQYGIDMIENDLLYNDFTLEQYELNKLIFETQKRMLE